MKKTLLFSLITFCAYTVFSQVSGSVSLEASYAQQSFYSLQNGEISNISATDWDLAFGVGFGATTIRINDGYGVQVYKYPNGDASDWNSVDTTGISSWSPANNSELAWSVGAFDQTSDGFNVGWGDYNVVTHVVTGNSIFIIQAMDLTWKKITIESLSAGDYNFKYADLDGSNETTHALSKADYSGKNFGYFSLVSGTQIDREPAAYLWDITFTKYVAELAPGVNYGVTGVLNNYGVTTAQADGVDVTDVDYQDFSFGEEINIIGYDWKTFNGGTFQYDIASDLTYFVNDVNGNIYQITFTSFEGGTTGIIEFETTLIMASGIEDNYSSASINAFPNPTSGLFQIELNTSNASVAHLSISDYAGKLIQNEQLLLNAGTTNHSIDLSSRSSGIYFLSVISDGISKTQKIVLK